jgi:MarR family transcriptional regulator, transcriptional regulator for hemolysin
LRGTFDGRSLVIEDFDIDELCYAVAMSPRPLRPPVGLHLSRAARAVSRAFDDALAQAGGSLPVWLVLLNLKTRSTANQRELADAVGIREATLTHHLNAMEADGLLTRRRDQSNRRIHIVELTEAGDAAFLRLRDAAMAFDRKLRRDVTDAELAGFEGLLDRLAGNVAATDGGKAPWAGLLEPPAA